MLFRIAYRSTNGHEQGVGPFENMSLAEALHLARLLREKHHDLLFWVESAAMALSARLEALGIRQGRAEGPRLPERRFKPQ